MNFEEVLKRDGVLIWRTVGVSMLPLIKSGRDMVVIEKAEGKPLKKNDVILYRVSDRYLLHRILKIKGDELTVSGDHNVYLERVRADQVIGVMTGIKRDGKDVDLSSLKYKLYNTFWCDNFKLRRFCLRAAGKLQRIFRSNNT